MISRADCIAMDAADPLANLRALFDLPDDLIYLDGNSLGARPHSATARAQQVVADQWGKGLIRSWNQAGWFDLPLRLGDLLAPLIGAAAGEVVVTDTTSVNLFKVLAAALHMQTDVRRRTIVTERANFPSDIYIAEGLTRWLQRGYQLRLVDSPEELAQVIDATTAVVMLTHVNYRTGYLHDMDAITRLAHAHGALTIWDLAHSAGAVELDLHQAQADFAVGCTYKYLNGGPGAPAFIWVPVRHQHAFSQPLSGWWAHAAPFAMTPTFTASAGIRRALCGTQPIVSLALVECGLEIHLQATMAAIRRKSVALSEVFISAVDAVPDCHDLQLVTPREAARRGSHVSISHRLGYAIMQALIARGVIGDYRAPNIMRFGFTPLYTRFVDAWDAACLLGQILESRDYAVFETPTTGRPTVT
ncbi:MAG: kynureninase [Herminiimonas sp.]|nr:kynureninase [Herminiimonas sp.]